MMKGILRSVVALQATLSLSLAFTTPNHIFSALKKAPTSVGRTKRLQAEEEASSVPSSIEEEPSPLNTPLVQLQPVFDFSDSGRNETDKFERIDDVIMGGISSSVVRQVEGDPFARWSGVCRVDGGGFCGMRTLPFQEELAVSNAEGMYITCRLSSDEEPGRRVWKITTRTEKSRGEQLYQAMFTIPPSFPEDEEWFSIHIPFSDFRLVRGARLVPNAEPLNTTQGLFQIGMTMSKFSIAENITEIPNFRPGFFELQIKEIGLYKPGGAATVEEFPSVASLSKEEAMAKRPMLLKLLLPLSVVAFTEKSQRRKSAMRILKEERGLTRLRAILFGLRWRANQVGIIKSFAKTASIIIADSMRQAVRSTIRYGIFVPLKLLFESFATLNKLFSKRARQQKAANED